MRKRGRFVLGLVLLMGLANPVAQAETLYAITAGENLISFDDADPTTLLSNVAISGLNGTETLTGLNMRPAEGLLYGFTDEDNLYVINSVTGEASFSSTLDTPTTGSLFGVDFNPVPDRLRIVGDDGQNNRVNVATGMRINDGALAYASGDPNDGATPNVTASGYTNSFAGTTATALYGVDTTLDILVMQDPPNDGTLNTIGSLGVDAGDANGFDISPNSGIVFAAFEDLTPGASSLYTVDLGTGAATLVGAIGIADVVTGLAVEVGTFALESEAMVGLTPDNRLVRFNTADPSDVRMLDIVGLLPGETLIGIDYRPANGRLYGLSLENTIYEINANSGVASPISTLSTGVLGTSFAVDFNPAADRLRVVGNANQNLRINVETGETIVDGTLAFAGGDPNDGGVPNVTVASYTDNVDGTPTTSLFVVDFTLSALLAQDPPNDGTLNTIGPLGIVPIGEAGSDISGATGEFYACFSLSPGNAASLYTVDSGTGLVTLIGAIGGGIPVVDVSVDSVPRVDEDTIFGLTTGGDLVRFSSGTPDTIDATVTVTGVAGGESLVGIDFRPADGLLYAVDTASNIYIINTVTGVATSVATLDTAATGSVFGIDFNPAADRLRLVSDADQNLRINVQTGATIVDGTLAYAAGDVNELSNPNIVASAYTDSFAGTTSTMLFGVDEDQGTFVAQSPPNDGTLITIGSLGILTLLGGEYSLDISPVTGTTFASLPGAVPGSSTLYTINTATGEATVIGGIGGLTTGELQGIAVALGTPTTEDEMIIGLTPANELAFFSSNALDDVTLVPITGLEAGDDLVGIDFRPATGDLFAASVNNNLYTIFLGTGAATLISTLDTPLTTGDYGVDFNPVPDRLRIVTTEEQNLRINVETGEVITDGSLAYPNGDDNFGTDPNVVAAGYTNSYAMPSSTALYVIDTENNVLARQNPPNDGILNTLGPLRFAPDDLAGLDVSGKSGELYASLSASPAGLCSLYTMDITTGAAILAGPIGGGIPLEDVTVAALFQSADSDLDAEISLTELMRVIQFFNMDGYGCAVGDTVTEDGYTAGAGGDQTCTPHDTDQNIDFDISLSEILRLIQFYNTFSYTYCPEAGTEDGYCVVQI